MTSGHNFAQCNHKITCIMLKSCFLEKKNNGADLWPLLKLLKSQNRSLQLVANRIWQTFLRTSPPSICIRTGEPNPRTSIQYYLVIRIDRFNLVVFLSSSKIVPSSKGPSKNLPWSQQSCSTLSTQRLRLWHLVTWKDKGHFGFSWHKILILDASGI